LFDSFYINNITKEKAPDKALYALDGVRSNPNFALGRLIE
jgi:hypothetical protein